ncbi:MAG TPA: polyphosphate kinase 2 family protein [Pyrinomonadaceae bacterium]|jgi:PPK2 family polyphosphate:nucleotide phosphotransferase|nr:polyphosphate kinase 2 family protein [Pyrinomonadaceae bacterium]
MNNKTFLKQARTYSEPYRITKGAKFRLKDIDPADTLDFDADEKPEAEAALKAAVELLRNLQDKLYAQDRWAILIIFQAMDAAGKDGAIKHVMSGVNPQGCEVSSFKAPSSEELDHDFLWRCAKRLPERGRIGIFNRSYYEETLVVRVHENFLAGQKLPTKVKPKELWQQRFEDICNFERYLTRNGIVILKFFLHVSKKEQKERFLARIEDPGKNWKFSLKDVNEREHWDEYMKAYEETIRHTASKYAPWYVVPADHKWFTRLVVASAIVQTLNGLDLEYPSLSKEELKELDNAKNALLASE